MDDILITGDDTQGILTVQSLLTQQFEMKDLGTLSCFHGLKVSSNSEGYFLSHAKYAYDLLSCVDLTGSKTTYSSLETNILNFFLISN